jgi:DNA-binding PadR family transcriptional regulator
MGAMLSTKHVVLGLLVKRPSYGYRLQQQLDTEFSFLELSETAVYNIIERLEKAGWIASVGERPAGHLRRVMMQATPTGAEQFRRWMARPCPRAVVRDTLHAKLKLSEPNDLPGLIEMAEQQLRECLAELAALGRPSLAEVASPDMPWPFAAMMMLDDGRARSLQAQVDWLEAICELMDTRLNAVSGAEP